MSLIWLLVRLRFVKFIQYCKPLKSLILLEETSKLIKPVRSDAHISPTGFPIASLIFDSKFVSVNVTISLHVAVYVAVYVAVLVGVSVIVFVWVPVAVFVGVFVIVFVYVFVSVLVTVSVLIITVLVACGVVGLSFFLQDINISTIKNNKI